MIVFPPLFLLPSSFRLFFSASLCNFSFCQRSMQFPPTPLLLAPKFSTQNFVLLPKIGRGGRQILLSALLTENKAKYTCRPTVVDLTIFLWQFKVSGTVNVDKTRMNSGGWYWRLALEAGTGGWHWRLAL